MNSRRLHRRMIASIVEEQHIGAGFDVARNDVPARRDEIVARGEDFGMRKAAGRDDHDVGILGEDVVGLGPGVETERDAARLALRHAPVDDADHLTATRALRGQPNLTARLVRHLEDDDLMAALGGDARRLQSRWSRADDDDLAPDVGSGDFVRHGRLAPVAGLWMQ